MRAFSLLVLGLVAALACGLLGLSVPPSPARGGNHGRATQGLDCGLCHTPAGWQVRATLRTAGSFDHDATGFPLRAGHGRAACTDCHRGAEVTRACDGCHVDAHGGKLGRACDRCHGAESFRRTDAFTLHQRTRLPLTGMHALVDCADCHRRSGTEGYAGVPTQCIACHEADYRRPDLHPVHDGSRGGAPFSRQCGECHRTDAFAPALIDPARFLGESEQALAFDARSHDRSFLLTRGPHRGAPCVTCHTSMRTPRVVRCSGCHAPAALASQHPRLGTPAEGSCLGCHAGGFAR